MDAGGLVVLVIGLALCFYGVRSLQLVIGAAGFAVAWLLGEAYGGSTLLVLLIAIGVGIVAWVLAAVLFRVALFVVGALVGAGLGAKLFGLLLPGGNEVLAAVFVIVAAVAVGLVVARLGPAVLAAVCAVVGAALILSGVARTFPDALGFLRAPEQSWQLLVALLAWLLLAVAGWAAQRRAEFEPAGR